MSLKQIHEELSKIGRITARWNGDSVSDIERELVLDKLKNLYEEVMFFGRDISEGGLKSESVAGGSAVLSAEELGVQAEEMLREFDRELGEESVGKEIAGEMPETLLDEPAGTEVKQKRAETISGPVVEEVADQPLFDMDEIVVRRRIDHQTILSLYGENCEIVKNESGQTEVRCEKFVEREQKVAEPTAEQDWTSVEPVSEIESKHQTVVETKIDSRQEAELQPISEIVPEELQSEPVQDRKIPVEEREMVSPLTVGKSGAVLGEVIAHGETLGDALARNVAHDDVASRVAATRTGGLRSSIGINDKFLLIRDLFGGDTRAYEEAISALEQFADLDEAMLYLHDHYAWNPDSEGVKLLVELLVRKLS